MKTVLILVMLITLSPRDARAHEVGLSRGEYAAIGAEVTATLVFAQRDVSVSPDTLAKGLIVRGDDAPCPSALVSTAPSESDGLQLVVRATCPATPRNVVIEAFFLSELPFGHRHLARAEGVDAQLTISKRTFSFTPAAKAVRRPSVSFLGMGLHHILTGYDHLVFLLGLVIVRSRVRELLLVVTAFTLGHSISLAIATLGLVVPSSRIVEPLIALSIVYVGIENLYAPKRRWRITLPFGLLHGFGFASALRELSLPRAELPAALALFNVGVELGQLAVLAVLVPILLRIDPSPKVVRLVSLAIVVAGFVWFALRVLG